MQYTCRGPMARLQEQYMETPAGQKETPAAQTITLHHKHLSSTFNDASKFLKVFSVTSINPT